MEIDIRNNTKTVIDRIRFDVPEDVDDAVFADSIWHYLGDCNVWVSKSSDPSAILGIRNIRQAEDMIKAIQKSIDLGWFED
jgi:hypothetical protein